MDKIKLIGGEAIDMIKNWYIKNWYDDIFGRGKTIFVTFVIIMIILAVIG